MKSTYFSSALSGIMAATCCGVLMVGCQTQETNLFKQNIHDSLEHYYDGENLERQRDFDGAAEAYKKSIEISARPRAYYRLAMVTMAEGDYQSGEAYLREAVRLSPSFTEAQQRIEMLQEKKASGDTDPASPWGPRAGDAASADAPQTEVNPTPQTPVVSEPSVEENTAPAAAQIDANQEASQAFQNKNWQQALTLYSQLAESDPNNALFQYRLGFVHQQIGKPSDAAAAIEKAVELNPAFASAWNDLGIVYESMGRSSEAVGAYQNAIAKGPENSAYYNLAVLMEKQGEFKEAISLYEKFIASERPGEFKDRAEAQMTKLRRYAY
ncbi:MAG: tetratricopeptide repeat protein [Candidatus Hinthialibacter antarcticus]|nr:tetratricopeptide repeat protein [Candidatus Hinthialibacter antarcticus]